MKNRIGLISVLYEQVFMGTTECCDSVTSEWVSNNNDEPSTWEELKIYRTLIKAQADQKLMKDAAAANAAAATPDPNFNKFDALEGLTISEFEETLNGVDVDTEKCMLYNTLFDINRDNKLGVDDRNSIKEKLIELCPAIDVADPVIDNLCTDASDDKKGVSRRWYRFEYNNGKLSPQARNEFKGEILIKLGWGSGAWAPGEEAKCIEDVNVWYEAPDKYKDSPAYKAYLAPALEWWDGFKISCDCLADLPGWEASPYSTKNLKITDLQHRLANPDKVFTPVEKSSSSSTINPVKSQGLEKVITKDPVEVETSYDVEFL